MKIVESYGGLYKMSDRQFDRMVRAVAEGLTVDYGQFGKFIGIVDLNGTDFDKEAAIERLRSARERSDR